MRSIDAVVDNCANLSWWLGKTPERSSSSLVARRSLRRSWRCSWVTTRGCRWWCRQGGGRWLNVALQRNSSTHGLAWGWGGGRGIVAPVLGHSAHRQRRTHMRPRRGGRRDLVYFIPKIAGQLSILLPLSEVHHYTKLGKECSKLNCSKSGKEYYSSAMSRAWNIDVLFFMLGWVHCWCHKKRSGTRYTELGFFSTGAICGSCSAFGSVWGMKHQHTIFMFGLAWYGCHKKCIRACYAELVFLHPGHNMSTH
jgi:hypothetical protein